MPPGPTTSTRVDGASTAVVEGVFEDDEELHDGG